MARRVEDLSKERALAGCATIKYDGEKRPCVGKIAILSRLGKGGMGHVYYGVNPRLKTEVAVKILPPHLIDGEDSEAVDRFTQEARLAAQLKSDHLVGVLDVDQDPHSGTHYIVMELIHGRSGRQWMTDMRKTDRLASEEEALQVCLAATKGLEAAHLEGVLHRDVKPHNILIPRGDDGLLKFARAKLADLGLARAESRDQEITTTGVGMGTPGYVAPEQARDVREARKPADVFGMGATLYALLTGRSPYKGSSFVDTVVQAMKGKYEPLRNARPDVSPATEVLIRNTLAPEPENRFADASSLREGLEACLAGLEQDPAESAHMAQRVGGIARKQERGKQVRLAPRRRIHRQPAARRNPAPVVVAIVVLVFAAFFLWPKRQAAGLRITSKPEGATVTIDGVERGVTPLTLEGLAGIHRVRVALEGYEPYEVSDVAVKEGAHVEFHAPLKKFTVEAGLDVKSDPSGAAVFVDNRSQGRTPTFVRNLSYGAHRVRIELLYYEPYRDNRVTVEAGKATPIHAELKRRVCKLVLGDGPPGATVVLKRPDREHTLTLDAKGSLSADVEAGDYDLTIKHPGWDPISEKLNMTGPAMIQLGAREHDGTFSVDSKPPGATVRLNGKVVGKTPLRAYAAKAGRHELGLQLKEHVAWTGPVEVRGDRDTKVGAIALEPWVTLDVSRLDPGVSVRGGTKVPPGKTTITLDRNGYASQTLSVTAKSGVPLVVRPEPWDRYQARLRLAPLPKDARAFVADKDETGKTVGRGDDGEVAVRVTRPGYHAVRVRVLLELGKTAELPGLTWTKVETKLDLLDFPRDTRVSIRGRKLLDGDVIKAGTHVAWLRIVGGGSGHKVTMNVVSQRWIRPPLAVFDAEPINRALDWFARHQSPDGRWAGTGFTLMCKGDRCTGEGSATYDVGLTGLVVLCYLGAGRTNEPRVGRALRFLLSVQQEDGCFGNPKLTKSFIYNHGVAALAVAEAYRLTGAEFLAGPAQRAVDFIQRSRNPYLAWRYKPKSGVNDTSVTGWMTRVLISAERAGLKIDPKAYKGARSWVEKLTDPDHGRIGYDTIGGQPARPGKQRDRFPSEKSASMTAVGNHLRLLWGDDPASRLIQLGVKLCLARRPTWNPDDGSIDMYYWYFGTMFFYKHGGKPWQQWAKALKSQVLPQQHPVGTGSRAGSWDPIDPWQDDGGRIYSTAMMCLSLERIYHAEAIHR